MSDRRCWLEVDLGRLRENYRILQGRCRPGCTLIGVVKANAYGMGAPAVARALTEEGCAMLSTADLAEALELRRAGIRAPILLLGPIGRRAWRRPAGGYCCAGGRPGKRPAAGNGGGPAGAPAANPHQGGRGPDPAGDPGCRSRRKRPPGRWRPSRPCPI